MYDSFHFWFQLYLPRTAYAFCVLLFPLSKASRVFSLTVVGNCFLTFFSTEVRVRPEILWCLRPSRYTFEIPTYPNRVKEDLKEKNLGVNHAQKRDSWKRFTKNWVRKKDIIKRRSLRTPDSWKIHACALLETSKISIIIILHQLWFKHMMIHNNEKKKSVLLSSSLFLLSSLKRACQGRMYNGRWHSKNWNLIWCWFYLEALFPFLHIQGCQMNFAQFPHRAYKKFSPKMCDFSKKIPPFISRDSIPKRCFTVVVR